MNLARINLLSRFLAEHKLLKNIESTNYFFDEPQTYYYATTLKSNRSYFKKYNYTIARRVIGNGLSFTDPQEAVFKSLAESIERLAQDSFSLDGFLYKTYNSIKKNALDPSINLHDDFVKSELLGWVQGYNLTEKKACFIPAQYAYYSYISYRKETSITQSITTGGSIGFTRHQTLLRGAYEVVERDCFMTSFLTRAPVKKISINSIDNANVKNIASTLKRYYLEWHLFDITNDLEIPTYMSIIIDRTGIGPAITIGASCDFDMLSSIIKSVSEAYMAQPWLRALMQQKRTFQHLMRAEADVISDRVERALYWYPQSRIPLLDFWLKLPESKLSFQFQNNFLSPNSALKHITSSLGKKGHTLYYCDISHHAMKDAGIRVHKVICPTLQGLYLDEKHPFHNHLRLATVAKHFTRNEDYNVNKLRHPFL